MDRSEGPLCVSNSVQHLRQRVCTADVCAAVGLATASVGGNVVGDGLPACEGHQGVLVEDRRGAGALVGAVLPGELSSQWSRHRGPATGVFQGVSPPGCGAHWERRRRDFGAGRIPG